MFRLSTTRLTRIVCCLDEDALLMEDQALANMINKGLDMLYLDIESSDYKEIMNKFNNIAANMKVTIAVILNVPSIHRIFHCTDYISVKAGELLTLPANLEEIDDSPQINDLGTGVEPGQSILLGKEVCGVVDSVQCDSITVAISNDGEVADCSRVYINGSSQLYHVLQEKQQKVLEAAVMANADFISFCFTEDNWITELETLENLTFMKNVKILAKVEHQFSHENLMTLIDRTDGVILSRGPLGAEMPIEKISTYQREIAHLTRQLAKPLLISGHVLNSLKTLPYALRADACDIYNGVLNSVDGFILNTEILSDELWERTLATLTEIITTAEREIDYKTKFQGIWRFADKPSIPEAIASSAVKACIELQAKLILCIGLTGNITRLVSKYNPPVPIVTVTNSLLTAQQCLIHRGSVTGLGAVQDKNHAVVTALVEIRTYVERGSIIIVVTEWEDDSHGQMQVLTID